MKYAKSIQANLWVKNPNDWSPAISPCIWFCCTRIPTLQRAWLINASLLPWKYLAYVNHVRDMRSTYSLAFSFLFWKKNIMVIKPILARYLYYKALRKRKGAWAWLIGKRHISFITQCVGQQFLNFLILAHDSAVAWLGNILWYFIAQAVEREEREKKKNGEVFHRGFMKRKPLL